MLQTLQEIFKLHENKMQELNNNEYFRLFIDNVCNKVSNFSVGCVAPSGFMEQCVLGFTFKTNKSCSTGRRSRGSFQQLLGKITVMTPSITSMHS